MDIQQLQYVLFPINTAESLPKLGIQIYAKFSTKSSRSLSLHDFFNDENLQLLTDKQLMHWLKFGYQQKLLEVLSPTSLMLQGEFGAQLLPMLIMSQQAHWLSAQNPILTQADSRIARLEWERVSQGYRKFRCALADHSGVIFKLNPCWYIDARSAQCGLVEIPLAIDVVNRLLALPALKDQQIKVMYAALGQASPIIMEDTPKQESQNFELLPQIQLCMLAIVVDNPFASKKMLTMKIPAIKLLFNYGGSIIHAFEPIENAAYRNQAAEQKVFDLLQQQGLQEVRNTSFKPAHDISEQAYYVLPVDEASAWLEFNLQALPKFRALNWQIISSPDYPYQLADQSDIEWYTDFAESHNHKWFDVELGISIQGQKINLLPLIVNAIENYFALHGNQQELPQQGHLLTKLPDGRLFPIPVERLKPIFHVLTELFDRNQLNNQGRIRLSRIRAAQLVALEKHIQAHLRMRWWGAEQLEELATRLENFAAIELSMPPKSLQAELRSYQLEGLSWLQFLRKYQLGGILADDMGLGKTIQTLSHIALEKEQGRLTSPCLVVSPTTLITNWKIEAEKYCPNLKVLVLHGAARQELFKTISQYDLVLTTYPLIVRDYEALAKMPFYMLILDEAQIIKNARSKAALLVNKLTAQYRICLTGTPLENHLGELWSLFHFLMPGFLGDSKQFTRIFKTPIEKQGHVEKRAILSERIAPFVLRRTKNTVALELPAKNEILSMIELETQQRDLYESIRLSLHEQVQIAIEQRGLQSSQIVILDALLKLRQICCDPRLLKLDSAKKTQAGSAKLQYLRETLPNLVEEGRRILLFSQFTEMLSLIEAEVQDLQIPYVKLTGQTLDRVTPVEKFQAGEVPLFLISLKAGGLGLNLTAADTVIHYDPWWNPAVERQATDRAHRIGQNKSVFVYKLIMTGTVEEKILSLQAQKQGLLDILQVDQQTVSQKVTLEQLRGVLECL